MADPLVLGIDPDTTTTAWAVVSMDRVFAVGIVRADDEILMLRHASVSFPSIMKGYNLDLGVVEGQQVYSGGKAAHADIVKLAQTAGGLLGVLAVLNPTLPLLFPTPAEWKKQTPKPINQGRTYAHFGIEALVGKDYSWPSGCQRAMRIEGFSRVRKGDWKHIGDAMGLALYGARTLDSRHPKAS